MTSRRHSMIAGAALALAACRDSGVADRLPRSASEYAGVSLERAEELPPSDGAAVATATGSAAGTGAFSRSCARRLRDPRNGVEFLLMHSQITTSTKKTGDTTIAMLEHATGYYALMSDAERGQGRSANLRVDCFSGHAVGWVTAGA